MLFPNQVERLTLSVEQAECLTSRIRSDVLWTFSSREALSAAQVAKSLNKSPQTIHYHVKELVDAGLLIPAGSRQNRSRTEILYVRKGLEIYDQGKAGGVEHNAMRAKSFRFTVANLVRETDAFYQAVAADPEHFGNSLFDRRVLRLTPEQTLQLKERLLAVVDDFASQEPNESGARIHIMVYARPTVSQSNKWIAEAKKGDKT